MPIDPEDWRIINAEHLNGQCLHLRKYSRWSGTWTTTIVGGWAKFAESDEEDVQHEGYATGGDYRPGAGYEWFCQKCFADLREEMQWTAAPMTNT